MEQQVERVQFWLQALNSGLELKSSGVDLGVLGTCTLQATFSLPCQALPAERARQRQQGWRRLKGLAASCFLEVLASITLPTLLHLSCSKSFMTWRLNGVFKFSCTYQPASCVTLSLAFFRGLTSSSWGPLLQASKFKYSGVFLLFPQL